MLRFIEFARSKEHILMLRRPRGELMLALRLPDIVDFTCSFFFPLLLDLLVKLLVARFADLQILPAAAQLRQVQLEV